MARSRVAHLRAGSCEIASVILELHCNGRATDAAPYKVRLPDNEDASDTQGLRLDAAPRAILSRARQWLGDVCLRHAIR